MHPDPRSLSTLRPMSQRQILIALFLVNLASFTAQIIQIGVIDTLLPLALTNAGLGERHGGMMLSAYWLTVLIGGFAAAAIIRRFHPVWLLLISGVSSLCLVLVLLFMPGGEMVLPAALFAGFGLILRWVVCDGLIVQLAPQSGMGMAVGVHETLMGLGIALGPMLIGWFGGNYPIMAGIAVIAAILPVLCAIGVPRLKMAAEKAGRGGTFRRWIDHWDLVLIAFVAGFLEVCFLSVLPLQAQRDIGLAGAGLMLAGIFALGGTLCQPVLGMVSDRRGPGQLAIVCIAILLIGAVPMALAGYDVLAAVIQFALGAAVAGLYTAAVLLAAAGRARGYDPAVLVVVAQSYTLGAIVGPSAGTALLVMIGSWGLPVLVLIAGGISVGLMRFRKTV